MPASGMRPLNALIVCVAYVIAYVAFDRVSYVAPVAPFGITPWNPPPALSIALIAWLGARYWPALMISAIAAEYVVRDFAAPLAFTIVNAAVMTLGYVTVATLLKRIVGTDFDIRSRRDLLWFVLIVAVITLPIAATYIAILTGPNLLEVEDLWRNILTLWVGDFIGIIVFFPAFLLLRRIPRRVAWPNWPVAAEFAAQILVVVAALVLLYRADPDTQFRLFYLLFLPTIWVAIRHEFPGAVITSCAIQIGLIIKVTAAGQSEFPAVELQSLMMTLTVTALFLGVVSTERRVATEALRERDEEMNRMLRLAAVSEMSSAVAHELNQPLAAIANYVRAAAMLVRDPENRDPALLGETLTKTVQEVDRAGRVMHRLRDFYQTGAGRLEAISIDRVVDDAVAPLQSRLKRHGIALEVHVSKLIPEVFGDRVQLATVIHNLAANAIDAIAGDAAPDAPPPRIEVAAGARGALLEIAVSDNGPGISGEIAGQVFEPFATTKREGLGLGLTISRTIVEAHGGQISVEANPERGAKFVISLPLSAPRDVP
ncbi:MAG: hypothetical protein FJX59_12845 [Alphaproteobacteria bacterium]|nr:hypothetical protein [Alphaproteobacteria bacterium]